MIQELNTIAQTIYDKKGRNILVLDLQGVSSLTDYVVIAEGNIDRHTRALAIAIKHKLHELGIGPLNIEGEREGDWIVLDYGAIVVHLFVPDLRETYALEQLWHEGKVVDVNIKVTDETLSESPYDGFQ